MKTIFWRVSSMDLKCSKKFTWSFRSIAMAVPAALLGFVHVPTVMAQTSVTNDYIYIGVEAEDNDNKDERWVLTTPTTPTEENDPDGNHSDQASGSAYLELLPDIRVTHADPFSPPRAFWGIPGTGPHADYVINFPEPGRYYIHARAYSTGTEDNGIHFGLNGEWLESSVSMQFCTASKRAWSWSSAQRDSGGNGSCGIQNSIWVDVPSAGQHTINVTAREDGFEIDRFALIKDLSNNTRVCSATNINGVSCRNGSIESADGFTDLRLRLESVAVGADPEVEAPNPTVVETGNNIELSALIENLDGFDTATDIVLTLSPSPGEWEMVKMDNRCTAVGDAFECTLDELEPTAPDKNAPFKFTLRALTAGDIRIDASVTGLEADDSPNNNNAATVISVSGDTIAVEPEVIETDLKLSMDTDQQAYETGEAVTVTAILNNLGDDTATNVVFTLTVPNGLELAGMNLPAGCSGSASIDCTFATFDGAQRETLVIDLFSTDDGIYTLSGKVTDANDTNNTNNLDSDTIVVNSPAPEPIPTEPEDEEVEEGVSTAGNTDGTDAGSTGGDTTAGDTTAGESTDVESISIETTPVEAIPVEITPVQTTPVEITTGESTAGDAEPEESLQATGSDDDDDSGSGSMTAWFVFLLVLLYFTRANAVKPVRVKANQH